MNHALAAATCDRPRLVSGLDRDPPAVSTVAAFRSRVLSGSAWYMVSAIMNRAPLLVCFVALAHFAGQQAVGQFGTVMTTVTLAASLMTFAMSSAASKYLGELWRDAPDRAGRVIGMFLSVSIVAGLIGAGLLMAGAPFLSARILGTDVLTGLFRWGAVLFFFQALGTVQVGVLLGLQAFRQVARFGVWVGLASLVMSPLAAYRGGMEATLACLALIAAISCGLYLSAIVTQSASLGIPLTWREARRELRLLSQFSVPMFVQSVMVTAAEWLVLVLLARSDASGARTGAFVAASNWYVVLAYLPIQLGNAAIPLLSDQLAQRNLAAVRGLMRSAVKWYCLGIGAVVALGAVASPLIARLYGPAFHGESLTFAVAMFAALVLAWLKPAENLLIAAGRMGSTSLAILSYSATYLALAWCWLGGGAVGVSAARVAAFVAWGTVLHLAAARLLRGEDAK